MKTVKKLILYITAVTLFGFLSLASFFTSCRKDLQNQQVYTKPTPYNLQIPQFFPTELNIPADNPMTVEGVELGRYLFYDGRLSGRTDSLMSCSTCHMQKNSFECGLANSAHSLDGHPYGLTGIFTAHVMLPFINLVFNNNAYTWYGAVSKNNPDPNLRNLEDVVRLVIELPSEVHGDTNKTKALIQSIPGYPELFGKAFGSNVVTFKNISKAIAQFLRTLISSNSKFDKYMRGEVQLSNSELHGYVLFTTEQGGDCFHCHGASGNPLFTSNLFYNNAKDSVFTGPTADPYDRYSVTGNPMDRGAYKATTLRNIALTGPYMHDGRFKTLDQVIDFYSSGLVWSPYVSPLMHHIATNGAQLTPLNKSDLKAFLLSLTDSSFVVNPAFSKPAAFPDGSK